jgi:hypothetical protein
MNKKNFGIRIGTVVTVILCMIAAIAFWLLARYNLKINGGAALSLFGVIFEGLI